MSASILYIHGFNSAPASNKACQLTVVMDTLGLADHLRVPALHHHPRQTIPPLEEAIAQLGRPLLVNPAVSPHRMFDGYLGTQKNLYTDETWELTHDHVTALAELEVPAPQDAARYQVWLQTEDETLDYRLAQQYYRACVLRIQAGGDHGYQGFAQQLPALLSFAGIGADQYQSFDFSAL